MGEGMTEIPGMVERRDRVARALFEIENPGADPDEPEFYAAVRIGDRLNPVPRYRLFESRADAAMAAHEAALRDAGMVIVPREPTAEMGLAGGDVVVDFDSEFRMPDSHAREMWRAMIAAAHRCSTTDPESTSPVGGTEGEP